MSKKRLNYKECREKLACLLDNTSILSSKEIVGVLDISFENLVYMNPYHKFHNFLCYTRRYAFREYSKAIGERIPISNIINLRFILSKTIGSISEFIQFCQTERIPLLYYIPQIKKYVFPNEQLLQSIYNRLYIITVKGFITSLKRTEIFGMYKNLDEIIVFLSQSFKKSDIKEDNKSVQYLIAFLRKNYIFGEKKEQMFERLEFDKQIKDANKEIKENLYSIVNLEMYNEKGED